jgi:WD40 repeat protein
VNCCLRYSVEYGPDKEKILSASWDNTIKEWDVASGLCVKTSKGTAANIKETDHQKGTNERLRIDDNKIELISRKTGNPIQTFTNIPGLFIQGCSFKNLHPASDLSEESKELLRRYGAILNDGS